MTLRTVYDARVRLASLFGCPRVDHVAFTANSTEALNMAINGLIDPGDHVISTDLEHNSVLRPLYRLEAEHGAELSFVPADKLGNVDYADFERLMKPNTRAVVCTNASKSYGNRAGYRAHSKNSPQPRRVSDSGCFSDGGLLAHRYEKNGHRRAVLYRAQRAYGPAGYRRYMR